MPAAGIVLKTSIFLLPLLFLGFWCSSSKYDDFPSSSWRVEVSDGSGFISISKSRVVEESSGSRAIVEESGSNESIRVEESTGGVVDVTGGNDGIGIEESDGAVLSIISSKSTGVKESDSTAAISNNTNVGEEEVPLTPFQRILEGGKRQELDANGVSCISDNDTDICVVNREARIDNRKLGVHLHSPQNTPPLPKIICPYAVKYNTCLPGVTPVQVVAAPDDDAMPFCQVNHQVPVVVFSTGGFATNLYHDFNDILVPLFLTARSFRSRVRFVVADFHPKWVRRYAPFLAHLSAYDPIYAPQDSRVHCFPSAVVGLKFHIDFTCNASKTIGGYSMKDFRRFLFDSYGLKARNRTEGQKPKLVLIARTTTRRFLNQEQMVGVAEELGFEVTVATTQRMRNLETFAQLLHSCDVMVGIHGAGMENFMFLHEGAVEVQVVPLGLEWGSTNYYGDPAIAVGVNYLEYRVTREESSLSRVYPADHKALVDPPSMFQQSYPIARAIYLDTQNVRIDVNRFRETLLQAMQLIGTSAS